MSGENSQNWSPVCQIWSPTGDSGVSSFLGESQTGDLELKSKKE